MSDKEKTDVPSLSIKDIDTLLNRESLSQPKVLIIEDCELDATIIKNVIEDYYPMTLIDYTQTRAEGLQALRTNQYDIVILDLNLPDTVNFNDILEFRLLCPGTPLIIATGLCNQTAIKAAQKHNADGIISKNDLTQNGFKGMIEDAVDNIIKL